MPERKRVPGPTTHTRRGSATGTPDRQRGSTHRRVPGSRNIAEQVAGDSADDEPLLGLLDLYLAVLDHHADRVRQTPDSAGDVGGRCGPGTAGPCLVLHP